MKKTQTIVSILLTVIFICLLSSGVYSQELKQSSTNRGAFSRFIHHEKVAFKLNYFGELVLHPGLTLGVDYTLSQNNRLTVHWDVDLGGYWHRWNNTSLFLKSTIGTRVAAGSVFADINAGIGYMHSFAAGTIYQRAADGGVEKANNRGHAHFMPNASFLLGYDSTRKGNRHWTVHLGPEVYLQSSYNHIFLPHIAINVGITYKFKQQ
ncbi:hypothetical protein [uncultured Draconibacterium sp.]|uniref:hypothetical protein n=1 Tax=uncultured Draconibacterium sp. TaxID=1573823 RepID=UPI0032165C6F